jgi:electron transfer flavoprotein alpha subunit
MAKGVWIVAEQRDGVLRKISFELASAARKLADQSGEEVGAVLLGNGVAKVAGELAKYGVDKIYVADNALFEPYTTDAYAEAVAKIVREKDPAILLLGATSQGKDLSSRLAGRSQAHVCRQVFRRGSYDDQSPDGIAAAECISGGGKSRGGGGHIFRCRS